MSLADVLTGFVTYGSGLGLGLAVGIGMGLYASLIAHGWYVRFQEGRHPAKAIRAAIKSYRELGDSLWESEKLLDFPEIVEEQEKENATDG